MKIRINKVNAFNPQFENLTPGSVHEVLCVCTVFGRLAYRVMGVSESVVVLARECEVIEE